MKSTAVQENLPRRTYGRPCSNWLAPVTRVVVTRIVATLIVAALIVLAGATQHRASAQQWTGYGGDSQHAANSGVAAQSLQTIEWSVSIDGQYRPTAYAHYGSPMSTAADTMVVPERNAAGVWQVQGINGANGTVLWTQTSDYQAYTAGDWLTPYQPTLAGSGNSVELYYQGAGGKVFELGNLNSASPVATATISFPGYSSNSTVFNQNVFINTPLTADTSGNVYFGYTVNSAVAGTAAVDGLTSGIARIDATTHALTFDQVGAAEPQSAPALSNDGKQVYFAMANGNLTSFNSTTLAPVNTVAVPGGFSTTSTASPTVGPDGNVYIGNLTPFVYDRGTLYQYSANLTQTPAQAANPGGFGWDTTTSIVPLSMVPWYHPTDGSTYLLFTKYNGYTSEGGGPNYVAILDPNATQTDLLSGRQEMKVVAEVTSPAGAEWCINTGVVDPKTDSIYVNNEDGHLYQWYLGTTGGVLQQALQLTSGGGQPYTATIIGANGFVYATEAGQLFAVGSIQGVPEPASFVLAAIGCAALAALGWRRRLGRRPN